MMLEFWEACIAMRKRLWLIGILLCPVIPLACQDIDVSPTFQKRSPATIAEQISDSAERAAFLELFRHAPPVQMRSRADAFLSGFPQSAYLAQAYEVAARASFDLQSFEAGLNYAEKSLALLPENPLFLVAVADVEAHLNRNRAAIVHAQEAMDGLDRFGPPSSIPEESWPALQRKLKASAAFCKGRSLLQQALRLAVGDKRTSLLRNSAASLLQAQRLNSSDLEATYVLGLAQLAAGESQQAANNFAAVYRAGGALAPKALDNLRSIFHALDPGSSSTFETFLDRAKHGGITAQETSAKLSLGNAPRAHGSSAYLGSAGCAECHADIYKQWSGSGMSRMFRPYAPENIEGDFTTNNQFYLPNDGEDREAKSDGSHIAGQSPFARMVLHDGHYYFEIKQSAGGWHRYSVDYTIGSKFQQAYATKLTNGEIHVFPIQYNLLQKRWINFWKVIDGPGTERSEPRNWEKLDNSTSYQLNCAVCHTSQLRNVKGGGFDSNNLEFKEPGIDCEMCHGPSTQHAVDMADNRFYSKAPMDPPVNFGEIGQRDFVAICAQCHMQSAIRKPGSTGELNYFSSGDFFAHHTREPLGEFSRKGFYKDGRFRQTTFIVEALERSQCFKKGQVTCGTCHDPHGHNSASNPAAVKFLDNPDLMCIGCHSEFQETNRAAQHSHHLPASEGSRCTSCHMPRIMDSLMFRARTHQIDDIPNAEMTQRFGQDESPNACLACHRDESAEWVEQRLLKWKQIGATPKVDRGDPR
jgi:predicted CXXCH cytochrome family protein